MKIVSSALSMDASTVHRDVTKTGAQALVSGSTPSGTGFNLKLPQLEAGLVRVSASREQSSIASFSDVRVGGENKNYAMAGQEFVGKIVSEIIGEKVIIQDLKPGATTTPFIGDSDTGISENLSLRRGEISINLERLEYQRDKLNVATSGQIYTADGRSIDMQMELVIDREEVVKERAFARSISSRFVDPLVLSFDDGLSVFGDTEFCFDLDCDNQMDTISSLKGGSGFLVYDLNGDGKVNDGSELFGPMTGSGYDELQIYDEDGNNWIDENDPVFDQLQLWMGAGGENAELVTLREAGVGALSLASTDAHFNLKDGTGRVLGQVSHSGLFLTEDGEARPLSEIDLNILDEDNTTDVGDFSDVVFGALESLREVIARRRKRLEHLASLQIQNIHSKESEKHQDWLLKRLWEIQDRVIL